MAEHIEREAAIAIIEEKQKELCPVGRYGRGYVYGSDREKYDAWDEIIDALENIPAADVAPVVHGRWIHDGRRIESGIDWCHCSECGTGSYSGVAILMLKIIAIMEVEGFVFAMNGEKTFRLLKNFAFPMGGNMDCR